MNSSPYTFNRFIRLYVLYLVLAVSGAAFAFVGYEVIALVRSGLAIRLLSDDWYWAFATVVAMAIVFALGALICTEPFREMLGAAAGPVLAVLTVLFMVTATGVLVFNLFSTAENDGWVQFAAHLISSAVLVSSLSLAAMRVEGVGVHRLHQFFSRIQSLFRRDFD